MTDFNTRENANYTGEPVALYEFRRGSAIRCYASCDQDVTAGGRVYAATPIADAGMNQKGTAVTDVFEISAPSDIEIAGWFANAPPTDTIYIVVRRFHYGDSESVIMWLGQVVSVEQLSDDNAMIRCQAVSVSLKRGGLRLSWQRGCPHALYDQNCQVVKATFAQAVTVTEIFVDKITISPNHLGDGQFWPGGMIEWTVETGVVEKRLIERVDTVSGFIYPFGFLNGFTVGMGITIYPGCKRTSSWCDGFFRNIENYGGFPFMPNRSPYDGDPIF